MALRDIILRFMSPEARHAAEVESRDWLAQCSHCGELTSIWDMGGIRYKAHGEPRRRSRCRACGKSGWSRIARRDAFRTEL